MNSIQDAKIQREIVTIKKQLSQERSLKLDAFHKVLTIVILNENKIIPLPLEL